MLAFILKDFYYKCFRPFCGELSGGEDLVKEGKDMLFAVLIHPFVCLYWCGV